MFTNKFFIILLILFFGICLFATNAFAGDCYGDENCFKCSRMDHRRTTGPEGGFMPHGCQSQTLEGACGIAFSRFFDSQNFMVSSVSVEKQNDSIIPVSHPDDYSGNIFFKGYLSTTHSSVVAAAPPIYLLNLSLLC